MARKTIAHTELWSVLLLRIQQINDLEPWAFIPGDAVLGVRDLEQDSCSYCCVMGQMGTFRGISIYHGAAGIRSLHGILYEITDAMDYPIAQDAMVVSFNDRVDIDPQMYAIIKKCGYSFRGRLQWPELTIHDPGYVPRIPLEAADLQKTLHVLDGLIALFEQTRGTEVYEEAHAAGDLRVWMSVQQTDGSYQQKREAFPEPAPMPMPNLKYNEIQIAQLARRPSDEQQLTILIDWFVANTIVDEPGQGKEHPFYMVHHVIMDADTGVILATDGGQLENVWQDQVNFLLNVCKREGTPVRILVRREEAELILAPIAKSLNVELIHFPNARDVIEDLRDDYMRFLSNGPAY